jgi:hypothetical protein
MASYRAGSNANLTFVSGGSKATVYWSFRPCRFVEPSVDMNGLIRSRRGRVSSHLTRGESSTERHSDGRESRSYWPTRHGENSGHVLNAAVAQAGVLSV